MFLLTTLIIGGMMLTGCHKDDPTPQPEPTPTPNTVKVAYRVSDTDGNYTMLPCFKVNVTYLDANGQEVTETDQTLPWHKVVEVTKPFHAKMEGEYIFDTAQLPETGNMAFGTRFAIILEEFGDLPLNYYGNLMYQPKDKFLKILEHNPDKLKFHKEEDFQ